MKPCKPLPTAFLLLLAGPLACAGAPPQSLDDLSTDLHVDSLPTRAQVSVNGQALGVTPATIHLDRTQLYEIALSFPGFQARAFGGTADALLRMRSVELVLVPDGFTGRSRRSGMTPPG